MSPIIHINWLDLLYKILARFNTCQSPFFFETGFLCVALAVLELTL